MKHVKSNHVDFGGLTNYDQEIMGGYSKEDIVLYGWELYPKWSNRMLPNIIKVYTNYGAHIKTYLNVTLFYFWVIDANHQKEFLIIALYHEEKYDNTWTKFISFLKIYLRKFSDQKLISLLMERKDFNQHLNQPLLRWTYVLFIDR